MFWNRTGRDIVLRWQDELSLCIEMGEEPLFYLGRSDNALDGLLAVQTLEHFVRHSRAVTTPRVLMGGDSVLWLYASVQSRPVPAAPSTSTLNWPDEHPGTAVTFTGVDSATHMASLNISPVFGSTDPHPNGAAEFGSPLGLPRSMRWLYAPITEPAADAPWSAVPFLWPPAQLVQQRVLEHASVSRGSVHDAAELPAAAGSSQAIWLAWGTILLVGVILLLALLG